MQIDASQRYLYRSCTNCLFVILPANLTFKLANIDVDTSRGTHERKLIRRNGSCIFQYDAVCLFLSAIFVDAKRRLSRVVNAIVVNSCKQLERTWSFSIHESLEILASVLPLNHSRENEITLGKTSRWKFHGRSNATTDINVSLAWSRSTWPLADISERLNSLVWRFDVINVCFGA